jgi:hypothetical protein
MFPTNQTRPIFWIVGGGKFGLISARAMQRKHPAADITVVDEDPDACRELASLPLRTVCMDGVAFLAAGLDRSELPDWIVPVVPIHLAYEWIRVKLASECRVDAFPVPRSVVAQLPNPMRGAGDEMYVSIADFECPENCPEPAGKCSHTGKPRPYQLFEKLAGLRFEGFRSVVVQSHQLSPGVGGFKPAALFGAMEAVVSADGNVLLSTACSCHGVMHAFSVSGFQNRHTVVSK